MNIRRSLAALAGVALLTLSGCSGEETSSNEASLTSTTASSSTSSSATTSSSESSSLDTAATEPAQETGIASAEPAAVPLAPPASPTATYMDPGAQYGEVCYSGTPDQWPNFVNPATGCGGLLNPNYVEPVSEPYIVECVFGAPGPTLMSDGTIQATDYCYQQGISEPGYIDEGTVTERFWACMDAGGTEETCRQ